MKCIVMQVDKNMAVLLDDKGNFKTVKNNGYSVGQTVYYRNIPARNIYATAASLVVALGLGAGAYKLYYTPVSYLSIEINPSIQLAINVFDRVIGYEYFNDDGKIILDDVNIRNTKGKASVEKIIDEAQLQGYLTSENNSVIIDVVTGNNVLAESLTPLRGQYIPKNVDVVIENASGEDAKLSKDNNISIAKAKAVKEYAQNYGGSIEENLEALKEVPVKTLRENIKSRPAVTAEPVQEQKNVLTEKSDNNSVRKNNTKSNDNKTKPSLRPTAKPVFESTASGKNTFVKTDVVLTDKADDKSEENKEVNKPVISTTPSVDISEKPESQNDNNASYRDNEENRPVIIRPTFSNSDKSENKEDTEKKEVNDKNEKPSVSDEKNSVGGKSQISAQDKSDKDNAADVKQGNKNEASLIKPSLENKPSEPERNTENSTTSGDKNRTENSSDKAENKGNNTGSSGASGGVTVSGNESGKSENGRGESGKTGNSSGSDKASDKASGNKDSSGESLGKDNSSSKPSVSMGNGFTKPSDNSGSSSASGNAGSVSSDKGSLSSNDNNRTNDSGRKNNSGSSGNKGNGAAPDKSRGESRSSGMSESSGRGKPSDK